jgi:hypothetical protein
MTDYFKTDNFNLLTDILEKQLREKGLSEKDNKNNSNIIKIIESRFSPVLYGSRDLVVKTMDWFRYR